jgi:hypothetical protein
MKNRKSRMVLYSFIAILLLCFGLFFINKTLKVIVKTVPPSTISMNDSTAAKEPSVISSHNKQPHSISPNPISLVSKMNNPQSKFATNESHSTDHNLYTSGNILKENGYILYELENGLEYVRGVIGSSYPCNCPIKIEFLNNQHSEVAVSGIMLNGFKELYDVAVPLEAKYIKIYGTNRASVYIWDLTRGSNPNDIDLVDTKQPISVATRGGWAISTSANNEKDSTDQILYTSGNLFGGQSSILYTINSKNLEKIQAIIGSSESKGSGILVEFLGGNQVAIDSVTVKLNGFKEIHELIVPANTHFIMVRGSDQVDVYVWEMDYIYDEMN